MRRPAVALVAIAAATAACNAILGIDAPLVTGGDAGLAAIDASPDVAIDSSLADVAPPLDASDAAPEAIDTATDPHNCGAIGHDCLGAGCHGGLCDTKVIGGGVGGGLATDAQNVYWSDTQHSLVRAAAHDGTSPRSLGNVFDPGALVLSTDGATLYVSDANDNIDAISLRDGGAPSIFVSTGTVATMVATPNDLVFVVSGSSGQVLHAALATDGGPSTALKIASVQSGPWGVGANAGGDRVYWANETAGTVLSTTIIPSSDDILVDQQPAPHALLVTGDYVVFTNRGSHGNVARLSATPGGGAPPYVLAPDENDPVVLATDGTYVYWGNAGDGTIRRTSLTGGGDTLTLAAGQHQIDAIAIDDKYVYWTDVTVQTVVRAPR